MPRYKIENRETKEAHEVEAQSAQEACGKLGWMIGGCYVKQIPAVPKRDIVGEAFSNLLEEMGCEIIDSESSK